MDIIFDFLFEIFAEVLCESFLSLYTAFTPDKKISPKTKKTVEVIAGATGFVLFICLIFGGAMLLDSKGKSDLGKILIGFPIVYFLTAMVLFIKKLVKRAKKK